MDGSPVALDTSVVVAHFRQPGRHDDDLASHELFLSATVLAELHAGAARSARPEKNREFIEEFMTICQILPLDETTAKIYGDLWADLASSGTMIPTNDIWIAASAIQHGLPLVTEDEHFGRIAGLTLESW